jgi:hypothetical protein
MQSKILSHLLAAGLALSLAAPAVEAAAVRPDFGGVWNFYAEPGSNPFGFGPPVQLPFRAEAKVKVDEYQTLTGPQQDNPGAFCLGAGMPASMIFSGAYPMEVLQGSDQITLIYEAHSEIRRIYFGDKVIPEADRIPDRNGYSVGRWEGDTLVVETSSLKEQVDQQYAHSDQAKIVERYHLTKDKAGGKVLVADWTLTDPAFYTQPVSAQKKWTYDPKGRLLPYDCNEPAWEDHLTQLKAKAAPAATAAKGQ